MRVHRRIEIFYVPKEKFFDTILGRIRKSMNRRDFQGSKGENWARYLFEFSARTGDLIDIASQVSFIDGIESIIDAMYIVDGEYLLKNHLSIFKKVIGTLIPQRNEGELAEILKLIGKVEFNYIRDFKRSFEIMLKVLRDGYIGVEPLSLSLISSLLSPDDLREHKEDLLRIISLDFRETFFFFTFKDRSLLEEFANKYKEELLSVNLKNIEEWEEEYLSFLELDLNIYKYLGIEGKNRYMKNRNICFAMIMFFFFYYPYYRIFKEKAKHPLFFAELFTFMEERLSKRKMVFEGIFDIINVVRRGYPEVFKIYLLCFLISAALTGNEMEINKITFILNNIKDVNTYYILWGFIQYYYTYKEIFNYEVMPQIVRCNWFKRKFIADDYRMLLRVIIEKENNREVLKEIKEIIKKDRFIIRRNTGLRMLKEAGV